jgi:hypothetical protein
MMNSQVISVKHLTNTFLLHCFRDAYALFCEGWQDVPSTYPGAREALMELYVKSPEGPETLRIIVEIIDAACRGTPLKAVSTEAREALELPAVKVFHEYIELARDEIERHIVGYTLKIGFTPFIWRDGLVPAHREVPPTPADPYLLRWLDSLGWS